MQRTKPFYFLILIPVLLGCPDKDEQTVETYQSTRVIIPGKTLQADLTGNENMQDELNKSLQSFNIVDDDYRILSSYSIDIDSNEDAEELIVVKNMRKGDRNLEIILVDIVSGLEQSIYKKTGQISLSTDTLSSLQIELEDITGNRSLEIVCHGYTSDEQLSLDIIAFEKGTLNLYNVFNAVVDGSAELYSSSDLSSRGELSHSKIIINKQNPETEDPLDVIKEVYLWKPVSQDFELEFSEIITAESMLQDRLKDLYYGNNEVFKDFLQGSWFKTNTGSSQKVELLFFDTDANQVYYYDNEILELYTWIRDRKPVYNKLYLQSYNEFIDSLDGDFYIEAIDTETIYVSISGLITDLPGQYRRLDIPMDDLLDNTEEEDFFSGINFSGLYKGNLDFDMFFNLPYFSLIKNENNYQGVALIYRIDNNWVMEFALPAPPGSMDKTFNRHYIAGFGIREEENHDIYTLTLKPIDLRADQIIPTSEPMIRLEQIYLKE